MGCLKGYILFGCSFRFCLATVLRLAKALWICRVCFCGNLIGYYVCPLASGISGEGPRSIKRVGQRSTFFVLRGALT